MSSQAKGALVMGSEMLRCAQHDNDAKDLLQGTTKHDSERPDYHVAAQADAYCPYDIVVQPAISTVPVFVVPLASVKGVPPLIGAIKIEMGRSVELV